MTVLKPVPSGSPVIGNIREFQQDRLGFLLRLRQEYGDIVRFRLFKSDIYLLSRPDMIKQVLVDHHKRYYKGRAYQRIRFALGNGLLTSEGDYWLRQRRLVQPAFHRKNLEALPPVMTGAAQEMLIAWQKAASTGKPVDINAEMMRLALTIVSRALFKADVGDRAVEVADSLDILMEQSQRRIQNPFLLPPILPTRDDRIFRQAVKTLDDIVYGIIEHRRQAAQEEENDLLSILIAAIDADTGERMTDQQLRDEVITLFLAGHETTANALTWTWYLLSKFPHIERKLYQELHQVLEGRLPTLADLRHLSYTRMVIDESIRLYPPAWLISRTARQDDQVDGITIPAGSIAFLSPYVTHRHPDLWGNPEGFDPERFSEERSAERPDFAYFPFGGGPRLCIGNNFALMEAQLVLATMVQHFRVELVPGYPIELQPSITLRPRHGILTWLRPRENILKGTRNS
jgi:cytochrome P450